ncbi:hypothetical protein TNCV_1117931 [Trichonephila clavipes]|nr:hypothetical protein TNCV_1117931 [Trichonephila clavipes]
MPTSIKQLMAVNPPTSPTEWLMVATRLMKTQAPKSEQNTVKLSNCAPFLQILKNRQFCALLRVVFRSCNPTTTRNAGARNSRWRKKNH